MSGSLSGVLRASAREHPVTVVGLALLLVVELVGLSSHLSVLAAVCDAVIGVGAVLALRYPVAGVVVVAFGLGGEALVPSAALGTGVYAPLLVVTALVSQGHRRLAAALSPAYLAIGVWSSRRAEGVGQWVAVGVLWVALVMLAWRMGWMERHRNQAVERRLSAALEQQRLQVVGELHDNVAHDLALIVMRAHHAQLHPDGAQQELEFIAQRATQANGYLRHLMTLMGTGGQARPVDLASSLEEAREELLALGADVSVEVSGDLVSVPQPESDVASRVVKEAVNNMTRHGDLTRPCAVLAAVSADRLELGFTNAVATGETGQGLGLVGMRERVESVGGQFDAGCVGHSWLVRVSLAWFAGPGRGEGLTHHVEDQFGTAVHPGSAAEVAEDLFDR